MFLMIKKELINTEYIKKLYVHKYTHIYGDEHETSYHLTYIDVTGHRYTIGEYSSEEKAMNYLRYLHKVLNLEDAEA